MRTLFAIAGGLALALSTVGLQCWLKLLSRPKVKGKPRLSKEDALWWTDWVVAGTLAMIVLLVTAVQLHKPLSLWLVGTCIGSIFAGCVFLPQGIQTLLYDEEDGQLKDSWPRVIVANLFGFGILFATVAVGANANG